MDKKRKKRNENAGRSGAGANDISRKLTGLKKKAGALVRKVLRFLRRQKKETLMIAAAAAVVISVAFVVWALVHSAGDGPEIETVTAVEGEPLDAAEPEIAEEPLVQDTYPEVNGLVERYFTALQEGDEETLQELRDNTENKDLLRMQENSGHIEAYEALSCYTKSGLEEDSYVVFAYYEVKFEGIETLLPGLTPLYLRKNAAGAYYFHDLSQEDEDTAYAGQVAAQEDVAELYARVREEYQNRLAQDEDLAAFVDEYYSSMKTAVGEALKEQSEAEASNSGSEQAAETSGESQASGGQSGQGSSSSGSVPDSGSFEVSDTINIRKSANENSEKLAVCYPGETVEILMKQADGWTRVSYQGQTGYVRSDVLK